MRKYLDENRDLILAIMENQNVGKFAECAQYQARLQDNLTYLAKIADSHPQPPAPSQMPSQPTGQQGLFMQHPQATMSQQQPGLFTPKLPFQLNDQHQHQHQHQHQRQQQQQSHYLQQQQQQQHQQQHYLQQQQQQQQQQFFQGQMGLRPGGMYQAMQGSNLFGMQGSKQDSSEAGAGDFLGKLGSRRDEGTDS
ncbi:hypothetical protein ACJW31_12G029100 [Castanea mollissima]